jgi:hypothetical protein
VNIEKSGYKVAELQMLYLRQMLLLLLLLLLVFPACCRLPQTYIVKSLVTSASSRRWLLSTIVDSC